MHGLIEFDAFRRPAQAGDPGFRSWIASVAAWLRSRMLGVRQSRRTRKALEALDDRLLKDVGIPRHEIVWVAGHEATREIMRLRSLASCRRQPACLESSSRGETARPYSSPVPR
jgi:uncharacterized protein YjiS (DUF1127 family)